MFALSYPSTTSKTVKMYLIFLLYSFNFYLNHACYEENN